MTCIEGNDLTPRGQDNKRDEKIDIGKDKLMTSIDFTFNWYNQEVQELFHEFLSFILECPEASQQVKVKYRKKCKLEFNQALINAYCKVM